MRVLVVGGGGREHALALALSRDPQVTEVHAAPGNPGTAGVATPMGAEAAALYGLCAAHGEAARDFSGIIRFLRGRT